MLSLNDGRKMQKKLMKIRSRTHIAKREGKAREREEHENQCCEKQAQTVGTLFFNTSVGLGDFSGQERSFVPEESFLPGQVTTE